MVCLLTALALTAPESWPATEQTAPSYLFKMQPRADHQIDWARELYLPREGDILLFDDHNTFLTRVYKLAGTDAPRHASIIFRRPDGSLASLEAGANWAFKVEAMPVERRLHDYSGMILIRRIRTPLTAEQAKKLTDFCLAQEGKSYALGRLALQATPLRPRGPLHSMLGRTSLDRDRWICSELVAAAAIAAEVLDPKDCHANQLFPRDLCYDAMTDLSPQYELPALWYPQPRLEMVAGGIRVPPSPH
jgi:hypothetical protein